ncbi:MAG: 2-oxoacid:acceptor oxidoreductase family protein [Gemmatimonadota bacterium]
MIKRGKSSEPASESTPVKYPGTLEALDGSEAVVAMETAASEAAGAYPITPSTQMGEGWAQAVASGKTNVNGRRLIFFEPEGEHAAAAVTAGMSMVGLRASNFSSGQGIAYMHESLYAAVGKRLTYVLNVAARAMTKQALNVHAGHDDYHSIDDTGFFQIFGKDVQEAADLTLIAHRIAELSLNPGISAQDGFLTSHVIESIRLPEEALIKEYLGDPSDVIESPTPAQRLVFGDTRRRIPESFDLDYPAMFGVVQNQDSYAQGVAAQRPFYFDHLAGLTDQAMEEYAALTGRLYRRASGYRLEDADYVLAGQGSVVSNSEAVVDYLRRERGLKVGVLNLTMFRPFPSDLITTLLRGKKGVTVLERIDQPLAVEQPLLREIRAAMTQGMENWRASNGAPHPGLAPVSPEEIPDFYSAGFGFGSRDLQPGDILAAVENMLPGGHGRRQYYLGIDFIYKGTRAPKLQIWQEQILEAYPNLSELALDSVGDINLLPDDSISLRIHSIGGWGAITMGKNIALTAFELLGLNVKANPKYGSEKKGQPTNFYATLSRQPLRINAELKHVDIVLSPDPNVFQNGDPLRGLSKGGVFLIQSDREPEEVWSSFPAAARRTIVDNEIRVYALNAFEIASSEASDPDLRYRMQGTAFLGAFFRTSPLMERENLDEETLFEGIRSQIQAKFGSKGERVVEDNVRVIRRGFDELVEIPHGEVGTAEPGQHAMPALPSALDVPEAEPGIGNPGRFWEQVCAFCATTGQDAIADPFAAISAIPAATSSVRDMTSIRFEIPEFIPDRCTGCSQCWMQCPDTAIPGVVNTVEEVIDAAIVTASNGRSFNRLTQISGHLGRESRKIMKGVPFTTFGDVLSSAYGNVMQRLDWDAERRKAVDEEFSAVFPHLEDFPLAKTRPFFDLPESREKGTGGLLSITVNPEACKGCNICVDVCPEGALITARQDDENVDKLRRNWRLWENLPETDDRYVNISNLDEGIGVLSSLLLKKRNYGSMVGGDGACMGCGEKTAVHILVSTIEGLMIPRVEAFVKRLDNLIGRLDSKARGLVGQHADVAAAGADVATAGETESEHIDVALGAEASERLRQFNKAIGELKDLRWRYVEGPGGRGRAPMAMSNSTGCSSVWGSTYPYNPYPFPWVNHLFQDAPSIAIGIFEGHMRKMADNFISVRRAELLAGDEYDAEAHETFFQAFDWRQFDDEEFHLCPPILAMGGDGAMLDIGFQNLSRLLASGKPIRVVVLDTQVYSNTGGQSCTSGFTGQIADMAAYGQVQHGKEETRKEMALIALAHRGTFVLQTSQASPSHMMQGILRGLNSRRPAVFNIYTPCPVEHGVADEWAPHSAKLALESRAFPFMTYDPDAGDAVADCIDLDGNPAVEDVWPSYELSYVDESDSEQTMELPLTIADWAATEGRFKKHFRPLPADADGEYRLFHEYFDLSAEEREELTPFVYVLGDGRRLGRLSVSAEIVELAEDRLLFWSQLKELAGLEAASWVKDQLAQDLEEDFERKAEGIRAEYEDRMRELRTSYPRVVARRMAEGLLRAGGPERTVADLLEEAAGAPPVTMEDAAGAGLAGAAGDGRPGEESAVAVAPDVAEAAEAAPEEGVAVATVEEEDEEDLVMEPYIDTALCTTCDDCLNINKKMFAYDENKQAYIKDPRAGTFKQLVQAAEICPAAIIHPGTPLNPKEKDLAKWVERAKPFS